MKTKVLLVVLAGALSVGVALHLGHKPPKDGKCPLKATITAKK